MCSVHLCISTRFPDPSPLESLKLSAFPCNKCLSSNNLKDKAVKNDKVEMEPYT